jgi:hypothetical protein
MDQGAGRAVLGKKGPQTFALKVRGRWQTYAKKVMFGVETYAKKVVISVVCSIFRCAISKKSTAKG